MSLNTKYVACRESLLHPQTPPGGTQAHLQILQQATGFFLRQTLEKYIDIFKNVSCLLTDRRD